MRAFVLWVGLFSLVASGAHSREGSELATFLALEGWLEPLNVKTCEPDEALS